VLAVHDRRQAGQIDRPTKERARCSELGWLVDQEEGEGRN
jgi:hypothetical protein